MKVWLLTVGEALPVIDAGDQRLLRTGSLARVLTRHGHDVLWWTSTFDHYKKVQRAENDRSFDWEGGRVRMLRSVGYKKNISVRRFVEHAGIARKFQQESMLLEKPDVILASLPTIELAYEAVKFGRANGVPVLLDIRDLWPDILIDVAPPGLKWLAKLILHSYVQQAVLSLKNCTGIVGISDGYLKWALAYAGRARNSFDAMLPLGYVPPKSSTNGDTRNQNPTNLGLVDIDESKLICWYVGSFGRQYDLAPVLGAARMCEQSGLDSVQFVISGDGELGDTWRSMARDLRNTIFTGWVGGAQINWLRERAALGLQPYVAGAPQGLANKLFEYLSAGIPVLSSLQGENASLLAQENCGLTYEAGSTMDCYNKLVAIISDAELRVQMGSNAKKLFDEKFDEQIIFDGLVKHLELVSGSAGK